MRWWCFNGGLPVRASLMIWKEDNEAARALTIWIAIIRRQRTDLYSTKARIGKGTVSLQEDAELRQEREIEPRDLSRTMITRYEQRCYSRPATELY